MRLQGTHFTNYAHPLLPGSPGTVLRLMDGPMYWNKTSDTVTREPKLPWLLAAESGGCGFQFQVSHSLTVLLPSLPKFCKLLSACEMGLKYYTLRKLCENFGPSGSCTVIEGRIHGTWMTSGCPMAPCWFWKLALIHLTIITTASPNTQCVFFSRAGCPTCGLRAICGPGWL